MAGDWIKVEVATLDKPEVIRMAELLGVKRDEMIGMLFRWWAWLDRTTSNGEVTLMSRLGVDDVMRVPGFAAAIESVGWARFDDSSVTMTVPKYEKHNGNPSKSRTLGAERKRKYDAKKRNARTVTEALPREEKRREEKNLKATTTTTVASLPDWLPQEAWQKWAKHRGSKLTPAARDLQVAKLAKLRADGHSPAELIALAIESGWATFYPPRGTHPAPKSDRRAATAAAMYGSQDERPETADPRDISGEAVRIA